ncbi:hypothetical protein HDV00_001979 [Rhizophlyctis rosea]|nr:hypothetical protein HDV00_001979 [Rhizophlyctis rosea]
MQNYLAGYESAFGKSFWDHTFILWNAEDEGPAKIKKNHKQRVKFAASIEKKFGITGLQAQTFALNCDPEERYKGWGKELLTAVRSLRKPYRPPIVEKIEKIRNDPNTNGIQKAGLITWQWTMTIVKALQGMGLTVDKEQLKFMIRDVTSELAKQYKSIFKNFDVDLVINVLVQILMIILTGSPTSLGPLVCILLKGIGLDCKELSGLHDEL